MGVDLLIRHWHVYSVYGVYMYILYIGMYINIDRICTVTGVFDSKQDSTLIVFILFRNYLL